ncbi:MAG: hypothetical protein U9O98_06220 [Asgard group archaeon]|nr:hypothetical protein [Asgard group archaeon]
MSKSTSRKKRDLKDSKKPFMERLPDNLPFVPIVRRPDYQLRFVKLKMPTTIPIQLIMVVILVGLLFIYIGGFYDIAQDPLAFGSDQNDQPVVITSQLNHQFLVEGMAAGILMFIGALGFFLIHYATQYAYSPKNATILLIVGIGVVIIAWVAITFMLGEKLTID